MTPSMGGLCCSRPTKLENRPKGRQKTNAVMPIPPDDSEIRRTRGHSHFPSGTIISKLL